jgi:hypothetical protein
MGLLIAGDESLLFLPVVQAIDGDVALSVCD